MNHQNFMQQFRQDYARAASLSGLPIQEINGLLNVYFSKVEENNRSPFAFDLFHRAVETPFDYYQFGLDFIAPLVNFKGSSISGLEQIHRIEQQLNDHENVIFLANHQTEPDPQLIDLVLGTVAPELGKKIIFVAGHRVIEDPLAIPLSLGRNLLCIYSKRHIENPPEDKLKKILHNQRTLKTMEQLLSEGGKVIYVAPSGGRDRPNDRGRVEVAPFDPQSIELFSLIAKQAKTKTHFYPMALFTYPILPPPNELKKELGEERKPGYSPVHLSILPEINFDDLVSEKLPKQEMRETRARLIWEQVNDAYQRFLSA